MSLQMILWSLVGILAMLFVFLVISEVFRKTFIMWIKGRKQETNIIRTGGGGKTYHHRRH